MANCCDSCDTLGISQGQQGPQGPAGASGITTLLLGDRVIFVSKSGTTSGTNSDLTKSFSTFTLACARATALTPSPTNTITIIAYPGTYTESFTVPQYTRIVSASESEKLFNNTSYSSIATSSSNDLRPVYVNGTITLSTDDISIIGINCNTISLNNTGTNCNFKSIVASTSITTNQPTVAGNWSDVHSLSFLSGNITLSGSFNECTGGSGSFAGNSAGNGGIVSGKLSNCIGASFSFGCASGTGGTLSGIFDNIFTTDTLGLSSATLTGILINSRILSTAVNSSAVTVSSGARVKKCEIKANGSGNAITASAPANVSITHSSLYGFGLHANVTNVVSTGYNTDDINDLF